MSLVSHMAFREVTNEERQVRMTKTPKITVDDNIDKAADVVEKIVSQIEAEKVKLARCEGKVIAATLPPFSHEELTMKTIDEERQTARAQKPFRALRAKLLSLGGTEVVPVADPTANCCFSAVR